MVYVFGTAVAGAKAQLETAKQQIAEQQAGVEQAQAQLLTQQKQTAQQIKEARGFGQTYAQRQALGGGLAGMRALQQQRVAVGKYEKQTGEQLREYSSQIESAKKTLEENKKSVSSYEEQVKQYEQALKEQQEYDDAVKRVERHAKKGMLWAIRAYGSPIEKQIAKEMLKRGVPASDLKLIEAGKARSEAIKEAKSLGAEVKGGTLFYNNKPLKLSDVPKLSLEKQQSFQQGSDLSIVNEVSKLPEGARIININKEGIGYVIPQETKTEVPDWNLRRLEPFNRLNYNYALASQNLLLQRQQALESKQYGEVAKTIGITFALNTGQSLFGVGQFVRHPITSSKELYQTIVIPEKRAEFINYITTTAKEQPEALAGQVTGMWLGGKGINLGIKYFKTPSTKDIVPKVEKPNPLKELKDYGLLGKEGEPLFPGMKLKYQTFTNNLRGQMIAEQNIISQSFTKISEVAKPKIQKFANPYGLSTEYGLLGRAEPMFPKLNQAISNLKANVLTNLQNKAEVNKLTYTKYGMIGEPTPMFPGLTRRYNNLKVAMLDYSQRFAERQSVLYTPYGMLGRGESIFSGVYAKAQQLRRQAVTSFNKLSNPYGKSSEYGLIGEPTPIKPKNIFTKTSEYGLLGKEGEPLFPGLTNKIKDYTRRYELKQYKRNQLLLELKERIANDGRQVITIDIPEARRLAIMNIKEQQVPNINSITKQTQPKFIETIKPEQVEPKRFQEVRTSTGQVLLMEKPKVIEKVIPKATEVVKNKDLTSVYVGMALGFRTPVQQKNQQTQEQNLAFAQKINQLQQVEPKFNLQKQSTQAQSSNLEQLNLLDIDVSQNIKQDSKQNVRERTATRTKTEPQQEYFRKLLTSQSEELKKRRMKKVIESKLFKIFSKRRGKYFQIGSATTKEGASRKLSTYLKSTLARSGYVTEDNKKIKLELGKEFRPSKRDIFTAVQIKGLSRGSGEVSEIMKFRRNKQSKRLNWF